MQITHKKIAEYAGVSRSLVSMALKDVPSVDPKTRERIKKLAAELGYRPNLLIKGIQTGQTMMVGVILKAQRSFFGNILSGIETYLESNNYLPIVLSPHPKSSIGDQINRLLEQRVDGIILKPEAGLTEADMKVIKSVNIPFVMVDNIVSEFSSFSGVDENALGILAAKHFVDLGHSRIAGVIVKNQQHLSWRFKAFQEYIFNATGTMPYMHELDSFDSPIDYEDFLKKSNPTAIFFAADTLAGDFINYAHTKGINIPKDISLIGAGDMELGLYTNPTLTTINQNPFEIGNEAAKIILEKIYTKDKSSIKTHKTTPTIVVRNSTCRAKL